MIRNQLIRRWWFPSGLYGFRHPFRHLRESERYNRLMCVELTLLRAPVRAGYGRVFHCGRQRGGITVELVVVMVMMIFTIVVIVMADLHAIMCVGKAGE